MPNLADVYPREIEEVAAAIALKAGADATPAELRDFVKQRVAADKYPRDVWLVDELPKGATGKILRREIHPPVAPAEGRVEAARSLC